MSSDNEDLPTQEQLFLFVKSVAWLCACLMMLAFTVLLIVLSVDWVVGQL